MCFWKRQLLWNTEEHYTVSWWLISTALVAITKLYSLANLGKLGARMHTEYKELGGKSASTGPCCLSPASACAEGWRHPLRPALHCRACRTGLPASKRQHLLAEPCLCWQALQLCTTADYWCTGRKHLSHDPLTKIFKGGVMEGSKSKAITVSFTNVLKIKTQCNACIILTEI